MAVIHRSKWCYECGANVQYEAGSNCATCGLRDVGRQLKLDAAVADRGAGAEMPKSACYFCGNAVLTRHADDCPRGAPGERLVYPADTVPPAKDAINPGHYRSHPSGVECIQITEHMNFNRGNAVKYIWRAGEKNDEVEDLKKARWYLDREIQRLEKAR